MEVIQHRSEQRRQSIIIMGLPFYGYREDILVISTRL